MFSRWSEALRHALSLRLGLWYAGLFAVGATALLLVTYALLGRALAAQDHEVLATMLARYASEYERSGLAGLRSLVESDEGEGRHERLLVRVVGTQAELVYFAQPPRWGTFDLSALDDHNARSTGWLSIPSSQDGSVLDVGTVALRDGVVVQVGRSSHVRDELLSHFRARAVEVGGMLVLIAIAGGIVIAYGALAPVRAMQTTTTAILQTRRFSARVPTRGSNDPLDQLGQRINGMLGQIEALLVGMRGALDNVAHDLRTPLTRFRNVAETALTRNEPGLALEALALAVQEADRVAATLTALMDISEAETGTMRLHREPLSLAVIVAEAMALHEDEADDRGIDVAARVDPTLVLWADRTRLRQVLANLIENAVKYTDPGGHVTIEATTNGQVVLTVRDTGIGIAAADLPFVWERLFRADTSRSERGLGLGLSLVKAIVEAHGGNVGVSSSPGDGSAFSIALPSMSAPHTAIGEGRDRSPGAGGGNTGVGRGPGRSATS